MNKKMMLLTALIFVLTAAVSASELRVTQLGSAWLVPDDYMDAVANPARVNYIGKFIYNGGFDNFVFKQNDPASSDVSVWNFSPKFAHMGTYGDVGEGIIYRMPYGFTRNGAMDSARSFKNDLTIIFGKEFGEVLALGVSANINTKADDFSEPRITAAGALKIGADYSAGATDLGAVLTLANNFSGRSNGDFGIKLLGGIKDAGGSQVRLFNETIYSHEKIEAVVNNTANPFKGKEFGTYSVVNNTGASFINTYNSIRYFAGINNMWKVVDHSYAGTAGPFVINTEESTDRSESLYLQAGIETRLFADWFILRASCVPLRYTHTSSSNRSVNNSVSNENTSSYDAFALLEPSNFRIGAGFELGKDMTLDVIINNPGLVSYNRSGDTSTGFPDSWLESGYSLIIAEFTVRI